MLAGTVLGFGDADARGRILLLVGRRTQSTGESGRRYPDRLHPDELSAVF